MSAKFEPFGASPRGRPTPGAVFRTLLQAALPCVGRLLLGHAITRLRITDEVPPRISVIDLAAAITTKDANQAAEQVAYVKKRYPEVTEFFGVFNFRSRGQKNTPEHVEYGTDTDKYGHDGYGTDTAVLCYYWIFFSEI